MIEIKNLKKSYDNGRFTVFKDVNTKIFDGDVIAIIGPSGTGKSTFLNAINLLEPATNGQIIFDGVDLMSKSIRIEDYRKKIGMVFQSYNLFSHMTVLENVMIPQIDLLGVSRQEAYDNAIVQLKDVGLSDKLFNYPSKLSGGQKQRVAIARTIAMKPEIMLFDEPTSALDPAMVAEVEYVIEKLARSGRTMLIVTHSMDFARKISNRVFYMDEKGIYEDGKTADIFNNPKKEKTRNFIFRLFNLAIDVYYEDFDYYKAMNSIIEFGERHKLGKKRIYKLQVVFEEICISYLKSYMKKDNEMHCVITYDDDKDRLIMRLSHNIQSRVGLISGDDIIKNIIQHSALSIKAIESNEKTIGMLQECEMEF